MALFRRTLAVILAVAVALAPAAASAFAASGAHGTDAAKSGRGQAHHEHQSGLAGEPSGDDAPSAHCDGAKSKGCCDGGMTCADMCAQKCFSQLGLVSSDRLPDRRMAEAIVDAMMNGAPDWSQAPRPPPPRV